MKLFSRSALALMAHPDDIEILCAGALIHLKRRGWKIHMATMTSGDCGTKTHSSTEIQRIRYQEAFRSARLLGATYDCVGEKDFQVFYSVSLLQKVTELIRRYNPSIVFTHPPSDYMTDHEECSTAARMGCFAAGCPNFFTRAPSPTTATDRVPHLFYADIIEGKDIYGTLSPVGFYVDTSATTAFKARMLACHASQRLWLKQHHHVDDYIENMKARSAMRGRECGARYAEGYRQHLGQGYPQENAMEKALGKLIHSNG